MTTTKLCKAIEHLIDEWGPIEGRTRLLKLVYLADFTWVQRYGTTYTEAKYYRWNHGPFSREVLSAIAWMDGIEIVESTQPWERGETYRYRSGSSTRLAKVELDREFSAILDEIGERWRSRPLKELLDFVYAEEGFKQKEFGDYLF